MDTYIAISKFNKDLVKLTVDIHLNTYKRTNDEDVGMINLLYSSFRRYVETSPLKIEDLSSINLKGLHFERLNNGSKYKIPLHLRQFLPDNLHVYKKDNSEKTLISMVQNEDIFIDVYDITYKEN